MFLRQRRTRHEELLRAMLRGDLRLLCPLVGSILQQAASRGVLQVLASVLEARAEVAQMILEGTRQLAKTGGVCSFSKIAALVQVSLQQKNTKKLLLVFILFFFLSLSFFMVVLKGFENFFFLFFMLKEDFNCLSPRNYYYIYIQSSYLSVVPLSSSPRISSL